uniref:Fibronectin type-III domain-containing protein n=1 Tax=Athene cunicularia TaxID=194338 RepID=A0A663ND06_ATHCN
VFVIYIRDSYAAHEPQELTVSGGARSAHISGLLDYTGYDINIKGTTSAGVHTEPLTAFVMTGCASSSHKPAACSVGVTRHLSQENNFSIWSLNLFIHPPGNKSKCESPGLIS